MRPLRPLLVLLCSAFAAAQTCTSYVVVAAIDRTTGEEIFNLKPADLRVTGTHAPLSIVSLEPGFKNRVMVLLEADGTDNNKIGEVSDSITKMAREAPEGKPLAFGIFAEKRFFTETFNSDPGARKAEINDVIEMGAKVGNHVAMYDALLEALHRFGAHQPGDTILLVADPFDDHSRHTSDDVRKEFERTGTRLAIMLRQPLSRVARDFMWSQHLTEKKLFEDLTVRTGGMFVDYHPWLFRFPWKGYMVGVNAPSDAHSHKWKLKFASEVAQQNRQTTLYYPQFLTPCIGPAAAQAKGASIKTIPSNSIRPH
jgi:hypothetical protein